MFRTNTSLKIVSTISGVTFFVYLNYMLYNKYLKKKLLTKVKSIQCKIDDKNNEENEESEESEEMEIINAPLRPNRWYFF